MWYVYILYSTRIDRYYVGVTDDIPWRVTRHNAGWGRYTKRGIPWTPVHQEAYSTKRVALQRERAIKRRKSRKYIEQLIACRTALGDIQQNGHGLFHAVVLHKHHYPADLR